MPLKSISFGVILGVVSLLAEGFGQLLIVSKLLSAFSPAEVGFWFVITNFIVLIQLGQGGLSPVGVRALSRALSRGFPAWSAEADSLGRAYLWACSILALLVLVIAFYIASLAAKSGIGDWKELWLLFSFGILCRTYALRWVNAINSTGLVGIDKIVLIAGIALNICGYWAVSSLHLRLAYLGLVYGVVGLVYLIAIYAVYRTLGVWRAREPVSVGSKNNGDPAAYQPMTLSQYRQQSSSFLLLNVTGFFVMNVDVLMVGAMFGTAKVTYFSILAKLGFLILAVSTLFQQMAFPFIARAWGDGDVATVTALYTRGVALSMTAAIIGAIVLLIAAPIFVPFWLGPQAYLGPAVLGSQLLFVLFSVHTISQATPVLATGARKFSDLAILNSVLAVLCSWTFAKFFGLVGIPLGNAVGTFIPSVLHGLRSFRVMFPSRR
jgi:O-antigen/teichoic acid export membrane protein